MTPVLELSDVDATYGAFRALFGVSIAVAPGEAVALIGPNGAGKTTVARIASGLMAPVGGSVLIDGEDMRRRSTFQYAQAGVAHAPEGRSIFATLTVEENLVLSGGEQRMLSMARVLVDHPKVLVADELSLGLAPRIIEQTYASLARLRETGTSLLVIEAHVMHALALCDRVVVLDHGSVAWTGPTPQARGRVQAFLPAHVATS